MEDSLLIKRIAVITENVKGDKDRLNSLLSIINSGKDDSDINGVLIHKLTELEHIDSVVSSALEYIVLLFTNSQTQRVTRSKEITEELVKILKHNLDLLDSIENCVVIFNKDINKHFKDIEVNIDPATSVEKDTVEDKFNLYSLLPNNKFSNAVFWVGVVMLVIFSVYKLDSNFSEHQKEVLNSTRTVAKVITSEKAGK